MQFLNLILFVLILKTKKNINCLTRLSLVMTPLIRVILNAAKRISLNYMAFGQNENRTRQRNRFENGLICT